MLQHFTGKVAVGLGINVTVECTPKCHQELAGEGIKWAVSRDEGTMLNREKVRKFSARARDFIVAYHILEQKCVGESASSLNVLSLTKADIERIRKKYRSHWGAENLDTVWCEAHSVVEKKEK
eukprot:3468991-Ditylum_brightwellii.AAC.1